MSRRKQPNPNKVKLMESATEDKRQGGGACALLRSGEAEPSPERESHASTGTEDPPTGSNGAMEEEEEEEEEGASGENSDGEKMTEEEEGVDLSSINAMMTAVMNVTQLNGGMEPSSGPPTTPSPTTRKTPPTPSSVNRNGRRNPDAKDPNPDFICPLCDKNCMTQHQLTMHIRQHNADTGATDHSCSICGKSLSSASSLDRHMLVHSGERPYKCSFCGQTFTTNGNMHRHMKIHDKDSAALVPLSPPSPTKRRRPSAKRRACMEDEMEPGGEPPSKKVQDDNVLEELGSGRGEDDLLPCPICFKTFGCKYELEVHMETHPDTSLRCDLCCLSFRTHRGLLRHNAGTHKQLPTDPEGRPFIQNNPSIPSGFNDLAFIDFSCRKFPNIAQVWCETNLRRCGSKFHRFVCEACDKAFPLRQALDLHKTTIHQQQQASPVAAAPEETPTAEKKPEILAPAPKQASFLESLGLQHISQVKPQPSEDEVRQAELDSIRVIHVESPDPTLPQEAASAAGFPGGLGLVAASSLQGLSQREALSLLSLQPFSRSFLFQPDGSPVVKPVCGEAGLMEFADIQQILKVASAAPGQMGFLPPLAKAPHWEVSGQVQAASCKAMPPLKPKPMVAPRSSLAASTPPPLQSTQQASLGCISPSLPPPPSQLKMPGESSSSSSSSSSSGSQASLEKMQMEADYMGDAHMPNDMTELQIKQEEGQAAGGKKGAGGSNRGGAKASYPCRFCDQVFAFSGVLQAHMRFHLGILPHQCNICDYVAPDKATLIRHLRTHSGERPYVCRVCHYPFTVKANCERHLRKKHMKNTRKEIEKNIKYVSSTSTQDPLELAAAGDTACRFCGEDLKTYRALQIHLRTHNGCQRKPFECRRCGAAFLAKRNCIHHMLKQHPEVQEREIEEHIATLMPAITATSSRASPGSSLALNGLTPTATMQAVKMEDLHICSSSELDQPLDFSNKSRGGSGTSSGAGSLAGSPGIKQETVSLSYDSMEPIDLSLPKNPSKKLKRDCAAPAPLSVERREIKKELPSPGVLDHLGLALQPDMSAEEKPTTVQAGCYQLSQGTPSLLSTSTPSATSRALRLKPLLPKPVLSCPSSSQKEPLPLASIAQIISSVSGAPDLLKRETAPESKAPNGLQAEPGRPAGVDNSSEASVEELSQEGTPRKRTRKRPTNQAAKDKIMAPARVAMPEQNTGSGIDLESSGEFASVEKMLATTAANKFSTYLQTGASELRRKDEGKHSPSEEKEEKDCPPRSVPPQSKGGKKNAYSNSVQKMTCPFCPRVFPWASSLQRHMLTHTGQKPFPCPKCDAFFSTKSNCERHLLRKHGVTNRSLRRNGQVSKGKEGDEGSHESAESSENEQTAGEALDLSNVDPDRQGAASESPSASRNAEDELPLSGETEPQTNSNVENDAEDDDGDDSQSNKSLDLNFASKLIDFKFPSEGEHPRATLSGDRGVPGAEPERVHAVPQPDPESSKYTCKRCRKNFRYPATLARHEKAHLCEIAPPEEAGGTEGTGLSTVELPKTTTATAEEEDQEEEDDDEAEKEAPESEGAGSMMDSGSEEEKEKDDRSDEEGGLAEPKNGEGETGRGSGSKADKRKKICNVCSKRFWSLQDLTRHMRSHTGERPYKCQTCERTFTLKHSLVRHQRIHLKPRGSEGVEAPAGDSASDEGECTPTSTCPPSENESEGTGGAREEAAEEAQAMSTTESTRSESATEALAEQLAESATDLASESASETVPESSLEQASVRTVETPVELAAEESASEMARETDSGAATQPGSETPKELSTEPPAPLLSAPEKVPENPSEGCIQGLVEIHTEPSLEHILPAGETPLVGVE